METGVSTGVSTQVCSQSVVFLTVHVNIWKMQMWSTPTRLQVVDYGFSTLYTRDRPLDICQSRQDAIDANRLQSSCTRHRERMYGCAASHEYDITYANERYADPPIHQIA